MLIVLCLLVINIYSQESEDRIYSFKKIGEIKEGFSTEESNYFWRIDDLCCDDENNLYVADRGWSKIFKFDSKGQFISSFGRKGQGPGEFGGRGLGISFGNDGNIYVFDRENFRLTSFSKKGDIIIFIFSLTRRFAPVYKHNAPMGLLQYEVVHHPF